MHSLIRPKLITSVVLTMVVAALAFATVARDAAANHTGGANAMSVDMNIAGNAATSLGPLDACAQLNENGIQDADETSVDTLTFDITVKDVPPFNDNGTPGNQADDSGGITAFEVFFGYDESSLTLETLDNQFLFDANPGSSILTVADPTPDTDANDQWQGGGIDASSAAPEQGSGVLARFTISSEASATSPAALVIDLSQSNSYHVDAANNGFPPDSAPDGVIALNQACSALPTPTPVPPPGPPVVGGKVGLADGLTERDAIETDSSTGESTAVILVFGMAIGTIALAAGAALALSRRRIE